MSHYRPRRKPDYPRAILGALLVACYSVMLLAPVAAVLGDSVTVTVNADGQKPRIVTVDLPPAEPTTQPSTQPTDPTTQPIDPDTEGRTRVAPGFDFSGKSGKFLAADGVYPTFKPADGLDLLGESRAGVVFDLSGGRRLSIADAPQVRLANLTIDGRGTGGPNGDKKFLADNANAMVLAGDGLTLDHVTISGGRGVNFGGESDGLRVYDSLSANGGAGNWGGKHDGAAFFRTGGVDGNLKVKSTDGGTWGKLSRSNGVLFVDCWAVGGLNAGWWGDINNSNWLLIRCRAQGVDFAEKDKPWTAVGFKVEISGNRDEGRERLIKLCEEFKLITEHSTHDTVTRQELADWNFAFKNCVALNNKSFGFDLNETRFGLLHGCSGTWNPVNLRESGHVSVRDYRRGDAKLKDPPRDKDWVSDVTQIVDFKALDGAEFVFTGGGAGTRIGLAKHRVLLINLRGGDGSPARLRLERATE